VEERVAKLIREGGLLATVESCTGGLLAHWITEIPGASATFWGSWVTYSDEAKTALGVPTAALEEFGAVSPEVAREMATAGMRRMEEALRAKGTLIPPLYVIATTGIAGPGGGTERTPVGLCYVSLISSGSEAVAMEIRAPENLKRSEMKRFFAARAIDLLK
jgi:PncC family amidohydrolase